MARRRHHRLCRGKSVRASLSESAFSRCSVREVSLRPAPSANPTLSHAGQTGNWHSAMNTAAPSVRSPTMQRRNPRPTCARQREGSQQGGGAPSPAFMEWVSQGVRRSLMGPPRQGDPSGWPGCQNGIRYHAIPTVRALGSRSPSTGNPIHGAVPYGVRLCRRMVRCWPSTSASLP